MLHQSAAWRNVLIVLILAAASLLPALGRLTLTEHEVFAAEPGREVLDGGSIVLQQFAGQFRLKKPPGQSWLIAASIFANRGPSDFAARLPSAIAGAGVAAIAALIGTWLGGGRLGLIAGLMMLTTVGLQQRAHLAEADMALACAVAVANAALIFALTRMTNDQFPMTNEKISAPLVIGHSSLVISRTSGLIFWAAVVAGFMLKGPIVFGFTVLPAVAAWAVLRFRFRDPAAASIARGPLWWPWILLGLAVIAAWVMAALHALPLPMGEAVSKWKHEIGDRVSGDIRRDPLIAYVWLVPQATLPWIVFAFAAIGPYFRQKLWRQPAALFLTCWGVFGSVMITAIAFKRMHYALPMLLPVVMLSAVGFDRVLTGWLSRKRRESRPVVYRLTMAGWFGFALVAWVVFWTVFAPKADDGGRAVKAFAAAVNADVPAGETVYLVNVGEDRTAWYLRGPVRAVDAMPPQAGYAICTQAYSNAITCVRGGQLLDVAETFVPDSKQTEVQRGGERRLLLKVPADDPATQPE